MRRTLDIEACPACGRDHVGLPFWANLDSLGVLAHPAWIGFCLEEGDPVALVTGRDGKETVVALEGASQKGMSR